MEIFFRKVADLAMLWNTYELLPVEINLLSSIFVHYAAMVRGGASYPTNMEDG